jgi:integrase
MRVLSVRQARTFLRTAQATRYGPVLSVALTTGMRPNEYLALKWQDINWARQTVSVVRSVRKLNGRWSFKTQVECRAFVAAVLSEPTTAKVRGALINARRSQHTTRHTSAWHLLAPLRQCSQNTQSRYRSSTASRLELTGAAKLRADAKPSGSMAEK